MVSLSKELIAASTIPLVLSILERAEGYGYALIKQIRELSGDRIAWSDGMLYPVLRRMENQGLISSDWRLAETGRRRRYYRIETQGKAELVRLREQWNLVGSVLGELWKEDPLCSTSTRPSEPGARG
jgi:DNA-binding PadR family transcriptional regulator